MASIRSRTRAATVSAMRRTLIAAAVLVALAGCGGSSKAAPAASTPTATHAAGPAEFAREARISGFGTKDFTDATNAQLLAVGNSICTGFTDNGLSYGQVSAGLDGNAAHATEAQVAAIVKVAVTNLCPQEASQLP